MYAISNLNKLAHVGELVPETMAAFKAFDKAALADGAIPKKYKELMAIAVALSTQCPYCIEVHRQQAVDAGATETELAETVHVAAALRVPVDLPALGHRDPRRARPGLCRPGDPPERGAAGDRAGRGRRPGRPRARGGGAQFLHGQ